MQFSNKGLRDDLVFCDDGSPVRVAQGRNTGSISEVMGFGLPTNVLLKASKGQVFLGIAHAANANGIFLNRAL
jgi:hypothetical protein